jgi:hypothetical protein
LPWGPGGHPFQESYGKLDEATKIWNVIPTMVIYGDLTRGNGDFMGYTG